jgi:hypothetical protein
MWRQSIFTFYIRTKLIGLFRNIKSLTSIRGWDAETREITLRSKGIRRYFFGVQLHSFTASKWSRIFDISKVGY